ncbi:MAG: Phosphate import ATP-binding protein PstB [Anaerolineae bacterium]|nr:Phosphate import ATP-binding protein PstB [Anaerolineae bacterium]RIK22506.1 MAG: phosphate ABC transporter ATP-binding protein [Chloroflexota bacterium]
MAKISVQQLNFFYGSKQVLADISLEIEDRKIMALIGPSGCGKSTFLRCLNRMNDTIAGARVEGKILLDGENILAPTLDVTRLRARVGMVFQRPNPFPQSVFDNVAFGPRILNTHKPKELPALVEASLRQVGLWNEVRDQLKQDALHLSLGQQQRLCIARALAVQPEALLMDEPCSALDPQATLEIEELMRTLREKYCIVIVTHNMQQAARVSDRTGFFWLGKMVEEDATAALFTRPRHTLTENYITGRAG